MQKSDAAAAAEREQRATRRRASTTLLGTLAPACPREATIHVTLERAAKKRGTVMAKPGAKKQTMSKKKTTIKKAQATDKALNP